MSNIKEIRVPNIGDFTEVPVIEVPVSNGDLIAEGDTLVVLESDKSTLEVPSEDSGKVVNIAVGVDDVISEGSLIMTIEITQSPDTANDSLPPTAAISNTSHAAPSVDSIVEEQHDAPPSSPNQQAVDSDKPGAGVIYASPSTRRYARQLGVTIDEVDGTGPKNRITREDIELFVKAKMTNGGTAGNSGFAMAGLPDWPEVDHARFGPVERVKLSRISKISGPALTRNAMVIPHVTHFDKADITELEEFRKKLNAEAMSDDAKITLLTFAVKAVVSALQAFPKFNSSLDGDELVSKQYWNIGVAADTPDGLLVPVIKEADKKGFREIAAEMAKLATAARQGSLALSDMQGATFTISSLGGFGGTNFTPIINAPEVAILGLPRSEMQPVWDGKGFQPKLIQPLALSFDHRVVDGVAAAKFLIHVGSVLKDLRRINI